MYDATYSISFFFKIVFYFILKIKRHRQFTLDFAFLIVPCKSAGYNKKITTKMLKLRLDNFAASDLVDCGTVFDPQDPRIRVRLSNGVEMITER